jgi:hypothetical protein
MATMSLSYDQAMRMQASARVYQQRYDDALAPWDVRAPGPTLGEDITEYRAKLAILAKKQLPPDHQMRKVQYRRLDTAIFDNLNRNSCKRSNVPLMTLVPSLPANSAKLLS